MSSGSFIAQAFMGLRDALLGLQAAWRYFWQRAPRGPAPRIGRAGVVEAAALAVLLASLIGASMILLDPISGGIRMQMPLGIIHFFERITDLGLGGVVLWPLGLALLGVLGLMAKRTGLARRILATLAARLGFLFFSIAGAGLLVLVLKYLLGRARPHAAAHLPGPNAQLTFDWLALQANYASFPSGHSSIVFATAVAFGALYPRARGVLIVLAVLVASSRVVLGSHYPSDVLAGGAVAAAVVLATVKLFAARRLVFRVAADGSISPMAGPSPRHLARIAGPAGGADRPGAPALEEVRP